MKTGLKSLPDREKLKGMKEIILKIASEYKIGVDKVILFGSRVRGDYTKESDFDILVVVKEKIDKNKKYEFIYALRKEIVWKYDVPVDIIVVDEEYFNAYKKVYGSIVGMAYLEGVVI